MCARSVLCWCAWFASHVFQYPTECETAPDGFGLRGEVLLDEAGQAVASLREAQLLEAHLRDRHVLVRQLLLVLLLLVGLNHRPLKHELLRGQQQQQQPFLSSETAEGTPVARPAAVRDAAERSAVGSTAPPSPCC